MSSASYCDHVALAANAAGQSCTLFLSRIGKKKGVDKLTMLQFIREYFQARKMKQLKIPFFVRKTIDRILRGASRKPDTEKPANRTKPERPVRALNTRVSAEQSVREKKGKSCQHSMYYYRPSRHSAFA